MTDLHQTSEFDDPSRDRSGNSSVLPSIREGNESDGQTTPKPPKLLPVTARIEPKSPMPSSSSTVASEPRGATQSKSTPTASASQTPKRVRLADSSKAQSNARDSTVSVIEESLQENTPEPLAETKRLPEVVEDPTVVYNPPAKSSEESTLLPATMRLSNDDLGEESVDLQPTSLTATAEIDSRSDTQLVTSELLVLSEAARPASSNSEQAHPVVADAQDSQRSSEALEQTKSAHEVEALANLPDADDGADTLNVTQTRDELEIVQSEGLPATDKEDTSV
jgi:hypothetical protein